MVGIVVVSHSAEIADGAVALARQMAGPEVPLEAAGGIDDATNPIGTDAVRVMGAIERAGDVADAVLVLMDLGSAVLSAELAVSMLPPDLAERTELCPAPLIEGVVAAAVAARIGAPIAEVAREARRGLAPKEAQLGVAVDMVPEPMEAEHGDWLSAEIIVTAPHGLHARPAARFVQTAAAFTADVEATNTTTHVGPARASSLTEIATLGVLQGHHLHVRARGVDATDALAALVALADRGFDESGAPPPPASSMPIAAHAPPTLLATDGVFRGLAAAPGAAVGPARRLRRPPPRPRTPGDPDHEASVLRAALERASSELQFARTTLARQVGEEHASMFDAQGAFLADAALQEPAFAAIASGARAETAWQTAVDEIAARFAALDDDYLRARAEDIRDVGRRVSAQFIAAGRDSTAATIRGRGILIAHELGAGETAALDLSLVTGIAVATGSPTSHSAILARALGIPAVVNLGEGLMTIGEDVVILVDGEAGTVTIRPDRATVARVEEAQRQRAAAGAAVSAAATEPATTRDGVTIEVAANVAGPDEVAAAVAAGADGVGLFRSEFLFMGRDAAPTEEEQVVAYRAAAEALAGRRLIIRTMDIGADKPVPYLSRPNEENPFLGVRGIRLSLAEPELFRSQLRAILRTSADHPVAIMFPMIATLAELEQATIHLDAVRSELIANGQPLGEVDVGVMIEVPSAALTAASLAPHVAFFSIGTNDLTQYAMAAERGNPDVAGLADPLHPAVLRLIADVCTGAQTAGRWVGVCGELASDAAATAILIGLGARELSVAAPRIGDVKAAVRGIDLIAATDLARAALTCDSADAVRQLATQTAGAATSGSGG